MLSRPLEPQREPHSVLWKRCRDLSNLRQNLGAYFRECCQDLSNLRENLIAYCGNAAETSQTSERTSEPTVKNAVENPKTSERTSVPTVENAKWLRFSTFQMISIPHPLLWIVLPSISVSFIIFPSPCFVFLSSSFPYGYSYALCLPLNIISLSFPPVCFCLF
jgi:hypothetical protein